MAKLLMGKIMEEMRTGKVKAIAVKFGDGEDDELLIAASFNAVSHYRGQTAPIVVYRPHPFTRTPRNHEILSKKYPGLLDEVRVSDIINSFKGIAQSLEAAGKTNAQELLNRVRDIYLAKIEKAASSSKFEKAATPEAQAKADKTKAMLLSKSQEFARMFS